MTQSTDGQICFGLMFEEDTVFPWCKEGEDGDIENWWIFQTCGKWAPPFELYDEDGEFIGGVEPPQHKKDKYYEAKREFEKKAAPPLPVELVNYCSGDNPIYILAVPSTCRSASRGYPEEFHPMDLKVTQQEIDALIEFCRKFGIETD